MKPLKNTRVFLILEAMREPAASTPVWDELEEWTRGRIREWMQQLLVEAVTEFPEARQVSAPAGWTLQRLR